MDFQRILLFSALAFVLMLLWQAWQKDYGPQPPATEQVATTQNANGQDLPPAAADTPTVPGTPAEVQKFVSAQRVHVRTDLLDVEIDTRGGDVRRVDLLAYPKKAGKPEDPVRLLNDQGEEIFVAQSGLRPAAGGSTESAPDHHAIYQVEQSEYLLQPGEEEISVRLRWRDDSGLSVDKVYTFYRDSYVIDVQLEIQNSGTSPWTGHFYTQFQRSRPAEGRSALGIYTYTGGVIYSEEEKYEKISFDDMEDKRLNREITGGWLAMIQHYFLGAWVPPTEEKSVYYSKALSDGRYLLGRVGSAVTVAPGSKQAVESKLFVGPKLQHRMEKVAEGLELTVDYGILTFIAKPIFWLVEFIYSLLGNWGWSIIVLTILIKGAFYKLSETSYKSMAQMRKLQPRLQNLKERYGDDRQKMNEAMMKMYKEEKINPLGGCLPILVQIPVFIALYWVLLESVEMRQAPFMLWITDLSSKDPYFVLPIIMGASMLLQHRLNPTPMDPIQARVMMALPIVFTVFFAFFPAGLVLYWVVNNILSITQQWYITRYVVKAM